MPPVTSADVGNPEHAGEYHVNGVYYEVTGGHISVWKRNPAARFWTVLKTRINDKRKRLALGALVE